MEPSHLSALIRAELRDAAPEGFHFSDHVVRQDAQLERLLERLSQHDDPDEVGRALARALREESDGWTTLKLLELTDRLAPVAAAPALLELTTRRGNGDERSRFLAGRACEVLLRLPLDPALRAVADGACREHLSDMARFRLGAERAQKLHRPQRIEWLILAAMMLLALTGFALAWSALS